MGSANLCDGQILMEDIIAVGILSGPASIDSYLFSILFKKVRTPRDEPQKPRPRKKNANNDVHGTM